MLCIQRYLHLSFTKLPFAFPPTIFCHAPLSTCVDNNTYYSVDYEELNYSNLLRKCTESSSLIHGRAVHAKFIKAAIHSSSLYLHNFLLNMYVKCGDLKNGLQLFDEMHHRNVVSWTAVISGFVQHARPFDALFLFSQMHNSGTKPNGFTFVSVLQASSFSSSLIPVYQVYASILKVGLISNIYLVNAFLTALLRHNEFDEALNVFENCWNRDIVSWNAMMSGYLQHSYSDVPGFWCRMIREGVIPDNFTFASVLTSLAALTDLSLGLQVHARLAKSGHGNEMCVGNSLVDMYLKSQKLDDGWKAFKEMPCRDVHTWTQVAAGCLNCGEPRKALDIVEEMREIGVKPNKFTLVTALNACANFASLEEGKKFHALMIKLDNEVDVCVDNALLDMYAKCGLMDRALSVFRSMKERTVVSWTTMIMGYAQNGDARKALDIYSDMRLEGPEPNYITFICVLYACSLGGYIDEAWTHISSMTDDYGISPGEDHYACMVNLLGLAGRTKEAEALILNMPSKPGVLVWQTLLGACRLHGDIDTATRAAEHALNLDRHTPSTYVLLSNTFADTSNWDAVGTLRELMGSRDVKKRLGSSWIS
ncbi:Pentatricopeptide repeat-containing protein [Heracleum sosnowskyi]|uniref:Pentatricopeptide repeat-containing protein n=1 Tax=Heracleum sosnowskyi TaxID=360622 RepID=A0AAD8HLY4_9APIA|nr:Pentatricopeptide repeat-containing protein [Heracleum sosnowskyi]